jgi:predicted nucleotidyltransferase
MIDVDPVHLQTIRRVFAEQVPGCEVRVFGSRINGTAKKYSDLDVAVVARERMTRDAFCRLKEAFEMSDLPFRVDVVEWNALSAEFKGVIQAKYEVFPGE